MNAVFVIQHIQKIHHDEKDIFNFNVSGNGSFKAVCNGDATSIEMFHLPTMKTFSGKLVGTLQSVETKCDINLEVVGKGLQKASIKLKSM